MPPQAIDRPARPRFGLALMIASIVALLALTAAGLDRRGQEPEATAPASAERVVTDSTATPITTPAEPTVAAGTCAPIVYTPPTAATAHAGELCVPEGASTDTVILVHGGGGYAGDPTDARQWRDVHLAAGRATFSIAYELLDPADPPTPALWPRPEQNVKAAVQFVRDDTTLPNETIVLHGFSAGARLAGLAATTGDDVFFAGPELWPGVSDAVDGAVLFYGYYDAMQFHSDAYYGGPPPEQAAAVGAVDPGDPPMLVVHGSADETTSPAGSVALAQAMTAAGAPVELVLVDGAGHGFDGYFWPILTEAGVALTPRVEAFFAAIG